MMGVAFRVDKVDGLESEQIHWFRQSRAVAVGEKRHTLKSDRTERDVSSDFWPAGAPAGLPGGAVAGWAGRAAESDRHRLGCHLWGAVSSRL